MESIRWHDCSYLGAVEHSVENVTASFILKVEQHYQQQIQRLLCMVCCVVEALLNFLLNVKAICVAVYCRK